MAYIGKGLVGVLSQSKAVNTMTGDGSDTTLTLSRTPGSVNNVEVYMDGVFQTPGVEYTLSGNTVSFSTAPETGTEIIALIGNDSTIITPSNDSISGTKIAGAVVTDAKIVGMAANKLSGALPAVDGSALTNIPSSVTKSASDPAIDTNPAGGVGTMWANTTSGEMYVLTDATAGENVWFNVGGGTGDVSPFHGWGVIAGFAAGGNTGSYSNVIDKHSFTADGNATDHADLNASRQNPAGASSTTHGYSQGGYSAPTIYEMIDKFPFASQTNASNIANITQARYGASGSSSTTHMYCVGGTDNSSYLDTVDKSTFSSDANSTDVGNLITGTEGCASANSNTHLYASGGIGPGNAITTRIEKIAYASDTNGISVGDIIPSQTYVTGVSSSTHGYTAGGSTAPISNQINTFSFSSDGDATDVGDLTVSRGQMAGTSSTISGYFSGGSPITNVIDKFAYSTNANTTDVGDLSLARRSPTGSQF
jgi:hypothetical protein